jgi:hypothetical protein
MARPEDRLALIEVLDREGRVVRQHDVTELPFTIGRALDNHLVLDDGHVAAQHARIVADDDGRLWLSAAPTLNGVRIGWRVLPAGERLALDGLGEPWLLGLTRLRVRLPGQALAQEQPLGLLEGGAGWRATLAFTLLLWLWLLGEHWVSVDPDSRIADWLRVLLGPPIALTLWCTVWGVASKLFRHRFDFGGHWHVAVRYGLALAVAASLLPQIAAALAWPWLFAWSGPLLMIGAAVWLHAHGRLVLPQHGRALGVGLGAALAVGAAVSMTSRQQAEQPLVGPLYMNVLPQPGWRLARPVEPERFVESANGLRAKLDERARAEPDEDTPDDEE